MGSAMVGSTATCLCRVREFAASVGADDASSSVASEGHRGGLVPGRDLDMASRHSATSDVGIGPHRLHHILMGFQTATPILYRVLHARSLNAKPEG